MALGKSPHHLKPIQGPHLLLVYVKRWKKMYGALLFPSGFDK